MAKNKTKKKASYRKVTAPAKPEKADSAAAPPSGTWHAARETLESIVIAFVLAFLFRTFEAEAFVIPTGSMSPSLLGQHKDVECTECGYRFRTTASTEQDEEALQQMAIMNNPRNSLREREESRQALRARDTVAGVCPMCRQMMPFRIDLPNHLPRFLDVENAENHRTYPGDRILVNKYGYSGNEPERWDVVVFKFPGNGEMNYIKRLVGLPGERLRLYQGDLFLRPLGTDEPFEIERKPADKVRAMLQPVHDTDYDAAHLYEAGWPLRWSAGEGWDIDAEAGELTVAQTFSITANATEDSPAWLRYQHFVPKPKDWSLVRAFHETGDYLNLSKEVWQNQIKPELISDFNPYNANLLRKHLNEGHVEVEPFQYGAQWVGDLAVRAEVEVGHAEGALLLDLVEAGRHFTCRVDLSTGKATFSIEGVDDFSPTAQTPIEGTGSYELLFANVDDQLLLWVDGNLVEIEGATYGERELGPRENWIPETSEEDPGDLAPVGIGAEGAEVTVSRLEVLRDIYYIAVDENDARFNTPKAFLEYLPPDESMTTTDGNYLRRLDDPREVFTNPDTWQRFTTRRDREFSLEKDQFFVLGDNSPASQDCRLWNVKNPSNGGRPGGAYLDRRMLTGEAVCVFWPHSWGAIPGLPKLPGFPNFRDMRIVR